MSGERGRWWIGVVAAAGVACTEVTVDSADPAGQAPDVAPPADVPDSEAPANEAPADEVPAGQIPDEVPAEEIPADEVPADEVPAEEPPADPAPPVVPGLPLGGAPDGGAWLTDALRACTFNYLWLKDSVGDLNGGPDLGSGYPRVDVVEPDGVVFVEDVLGMYSGGGLRGALTLAAIPDGAGGALVFGSIVGSTIEVELQPLAVGPTAPVLVDGVRQRPPGTAVLRTVGAPDLPLRWGLMFSPTASAGNPVCAAAADAYWGP